MTDLFIFAGEASADLLGQELLKGLNSQKLKITGVGGPKMRAGGFFGIAQMEEFRVMGFVDVFLALPKLIRKFFAIRREILAMSPKVVLFIDYPGFNLRMAKSLRKKGFSGKICHFVCPSVWAWGKKRIPLMAKTLDLLLTILPFEPRYFTHTSLKAKYVGHPLAERIKAHTYRDNLFPKEKRLIGIFPGSRKKEILRNFPQHLRVAKRLLALYPDLLFGVSISHPSFIPLLKEMAAREGVEIILVPPDQTYDLMRASTAAIAKSGTVTLELALHAVPTVVTYAISPLDLFIARDLLRIRLPYYCLVNIIQEEEVFPELFGPHFTEERLFGHLHTLLTDSTAQQSCKKKCEQIKTNLSQKETVKEVVSCLKEMMAMNDE
ncbi:MAG: lipid-A-disaccharide synthase [Chlamydiales bacterium]